VRRLSRILGSLLLAAGVLTLAWVILVWQWQDPFTALYTHFQQAHLSHVYEKRAAAFHPRDTHGDLAAAERAVAEEAAAYRRTLHRGDPVGRLKIGRIGLNMVVVQGTDEETLKKGPGHYIASALPGQGHLIYVAGHRTTYLAPFAYINDIRVGDYIEFQVPYGTFTYRVFRHYVVPYNAVQVLQDHGREILRLQACHPRFFATHRYIVDARLVAVAPRGGTPYATPTRAAT
jgi:sortase A